MLHEALFIAFLAVTALRVGVHAGWSNPQTLFLGGLTVALPLAILLFSCSISRWAWRARLFLFVPLMCFVFRDLRQSVPLFHPVHVDTLLQTLDLRIFGLSLPEWLSGRFGPAATDAMSLCYALFFPYLLVCTIGWLFAAPRKARAFYSGLFTLYAIGFTGYTLLPALGPYATMSFAQPVHGFAITRMLLDAVPLGTNRADAFPSLHCAVTAFLLGFEALFGSGRRAAFCALPVCILWLSTLALRFHYGVDVLAGFLLAIACLFLSALLLRTRRNISSRTTIPHGARSWA